jgi:spoIIIJ-associated protein
MEFEGESLEEALSRASESAGVPLEELDYEVMQEGRRGFLGMGGRGVRIRIRPREEGDPAQADRPAKAPAGAVPGEPPPADTARVQEFLEEFAATSPFEIEFSVTDDSETIRIEMEGRDRYLFLTRRGEGLNALQVILGRIASQAGSSRAVFLDCGDFRRSREEELTEIALLTAEKAKKLGEPQSLSPMNPYERRLVHLALKDDPAVETKSDGDSFLKSVVIYPREPEQKR